MRYGRGKEFLFSYKVVEQQRTLKGGGGGGLGEAEYYMLDRISLWRFFAFFRSLILILIFDSLSGR